MAYPKLVPSDRQSHRKARNSQAQKASVHGTGREASVGPACRHQGVPMPSRRKPPETKSPIRVATLPRSRRAPRAGQNRRSPAPTDASTKRWRRDVRPRAVRSAVSATAMLRWSPSLMEVLLEELYMDDGLEGLLGKSRSDLRVRQYPGAVAAALILRHSWRADDLACILERLGVTSGRKFTPARPSPKPTSKRVNFSS
jgi:hypothetical protein